MSAGENDNLEPGSSAWVEAFHHISVRAKRKPRLTGSKPAVWFGTPRHGRAHGITPEVEAWDVAFKRVLHEVRRDGRIHHPKLLALGDRGRSSQGEQQHGGDACLRAPNSARDPRSVVVAEHPVRPSPNR